MDFLVDLLGCLGEAFSDLLYLFAVVNVPCFPSFDDSTKLLFKAIDLIQCEFVSFSCDVGFEVGLYFFSTEIDKLEEYFFIGISIFFIEEFFEGPVLLFEEFDFDLFGFAYFSLFFFQGVDIEGSFIDG